MCRVIKTVAAVMSFGLASVAIAGPEWIETTLGDAGILPPDAQPTGGKGILGRVTGTIGELLPFSGRSKKNPQDMFIIKIDDPSQFSATTVPTNGSANFDTQLWLFTLDGHGLLGSDDTFQTDDGKSGCIVSGSTLMPSATDGSGQTIPGPGLYLLAISGTGVVPASSDGPIFHFVSQTEISGPDGPGGNGPIISWSDSGMFEGALGDYSISLTGSSMSGLFMDIRPGTCPNPLNPGSMGVLPVWLLGTGGFNIHQVNIATIVISRSDGVGGSSPVLVSPPPNEKDTGTPFTGALSLCDCHDAGGDNNADLGLKFNISAMAAALQLDGVPDGSIIELEISGEFSDGSTFAARDCVRIVPPSLFDEELDR